MPFLRRYRRCRQPSALAAPGLLSEASTEILYYKMSEPPFIERLFEDHHHRRHYLRRVCHTLTPPLRREMPLRASAVCAIAELREVIKEAGARI